MHSRIFQISDHPVNPDDYISPDWYNEDHWFVPEIADYVVQDECREKSLDWFFEIFSDCGDYVEKICEDEQIGFILQPGFHDAYFQPAYEAFQRALRSLEESATFDQFNRYDLSGKMFLLQQAYDQKYDFYVATGEDGLITLTSFLRQAAEGQRYYLGGTLDYHC